MWSMQQSGLSRMRIRGVRSDLPGGLVPDTIRLGRGGGGLKLAIYYILHVYYI